MTQKKGNGLNEKLTGGGEKSGSTRSSSPSTESTSSEDSSYHSMDEVEAKPVQPRPEVKASGGGFFSRWFVAKKQEGLKEGLLSHDQKEAAKDKDKKDDGGYTPPSI